METIDSQTNKYRITDFELEETAVPKMKKCVFCAETIQAGAIKCRYCGEFLNTDKAKRLEASPANKDENQEDDSKILFAGRPSLWGLVGAGVKGLIFAAIGVFLTKYPLEDFAANSAARFFSYEFSDSQYFAVSDFRMVIGIGLIILVVLLFLWKVLKLKMIYYEVTADRIEWSRGIFDRRVDNLDMFRVVDLKLRRSFLDCMLGIGTVGLITTDKTDPQFIFEKVRNCRGLYDAIKRASLEADRRQGVVHLE